MQIEQIQVDAFGIKFYIAEQGKEVGRTYLYILRNDLHKQPFGFIEDVFVDPSQRGKGYASALVKKVIDEAKARGCYKLILTCRNSKPEVQQMYRNLGFKDQGLEQRLDF